MRLEESLPQAAAHPAHRQRHYGRGHHGGDRLRHQHRRQARGQCGTGQHGNERPLRQYGIRYPLHGKPGGHPAAFRGGNRHAPDDRIFHLSSGQRQRQHPDLRHRFRRPAGHLPASAARPPYHHRRRAQQRPGMYAG